MVVHKAIGGFFKKKLKAIVRKGKALFRPKPSDSRSIIDRAKDVAKELPGLTPVGIVRGVIRERSSRRSSSTSGGGSTLQSVTERVNRAGLGRDSTTAEKLGAGLALSGVAGTTAVVAGTGARFAGATGQMAFLPSLVRQAPRLAKVGAALGAGGFLAEQAAELLGVRGGAGFIGRRPGVTGRRGSSRKRFLNKNAMKIIRRAHGLKKQVKKAAQMMGMSVTQRGHRHSQTKTILVEPAHHNSRH